MAAARRPKKPLGKRRAGWAKKSDRDAREPQLSVFSAKKYKIN
jgi:hypothetical protein